MNHNESPSQLDDTINKPKLIVFAGPPLSGKSTLSKKILHHINNCAYLEMDELRLEKLPDSEHNKKDRNIAYRLIHKKADDEIQKGKTVIVVASYAPFEHRRSIVEISEKRSVSIYLIECKVSPEDAVKRFLERQKDHAGIDLTVTRVREIANEFPIYGGGLIVDTSKYKEDQCEREIVNYLKEGVPLWSPNDWVLSSQLEQQKDKSFESLNIQKNSQRNIEFSTYDEIKLEKKISPASRKHARNKIMFYVIPFALALCLYGIGMENLLYAYSNKSDLLFSQATAYMTAAFFIFSIPPVVNFLEKPFRESLEIIRAGNIPSYGQVKEVFRTNRSLFNEYVERTSKNKLNNGFLLDGIPIFFMIHPKKDFTFDVRVNCSKIEHNIETKRQRYLSEEAAKFGFDWTGYSKWRIHKKASEYYGMEIWTKLLSITSLNFIENRNERYYEITGSTIRYNDYLLAEQSVNLEIPGQLPYMREFFEGPDWWSKDVDLNSLEKAAKRFSMMVSITVLIVTIDNYLVFQRRSIRVQAGQGGLTTSASGSVEWNDVDGRKIFHEGIIPRIRQTNERYSLKNSVFREIREEIGLLKDDFFENDKPFIAAAFNLKYGRDLNFYALLKSKLSREDISRTFNKEGLKKLIYSAGHDQWEMAHLVFMPLEWLKNDNPEFISKRNEILGDARHAQGIIKAIQIYNGWTTHN